MSKQFIASFLFVFISLSHAETLNTPSKIDSQKLTVTAVLPSHFLNQFGSQDVDSLLNNTFSFTNRVLGQLVKKDFKLKSIVQRPDLVISVEDDVSHLCQPYLKESDLCLVLNYRSFEDILSALDDDNGFTVGHSGFFSREIYIDVNDFMFEYPLEFMTAIVHEFAHIFGGFHVNEENNTTIMSPRADIIDVSQFQLDRYNVFWFEKFAPHFSLVCKFDCIPTHLKQLYSYLLQEAGLNETSSIVSHYSEIFTKDLERHLYVSGFKQLRKILDSIYGDSLLEVRKRSLSTQIDIIKQNSYILDTYMNIFTEVETVLPRPWEPEVLRTLKQKELLPEDQELEKVIKQHIFLGHMILPLIEYYKVINPDRGGFYETIVSNYINKIQNRNPNYECSMLFPLNRIPNRMELPMIEFILCKNTSLNHFINYLSLVKKRINY